ncbi:MAG: cupredoxin domain-containing protein, partial [Actinomycetota bacterium]
MTVVPQENQKQIAIKNESGWTRGITAMMLAVIAIPTIVIGIVAVVALLKNNSVSSAVSVQVELSEFKIAMSSSAVKPGDVTFQIKNSGTVAHNFVIPKLNIRSEMINPGESTSVVAHGVVAGDYEINCEVSGHLAAGMKTMFIVSADAPSSDSHVMADGEAMNSMASMSWQEMDAKMAEVALKFPAKTEGLGNRELSPIISDDGYKVFNLTASIIKWEVEPGKFV